MFAGNFFGARFFPTRYFAKVGADAVAGTGGSFGGKYMIYEDDEEGWF